MVASHCIVNSPDGQVETAWAEGDYHFTDKSWGWYDIYYYEQEQNQYPILYAMANIADTLNVYYINIVTDNYELMFKEYLGESSGNYDGAAYDEEDGLFFFANYNSCELWVNQFLDEGPSFSAGTLQGISASGTYYDGSYYYVDAEMNSVNKVSFSSDWQIESITVLSLIPDVVTVNDIAMSPSGEYLYIIAQVSGDDTELLKWDPLVDIYYSLSIGLPDDAQIAFGSDDKLYAISSLNAGPGSTLYEIQVDSGIMVPVVDSILTDEDPFADMSHGPSL